MEKIDLHQVRGFSDSITVTFNFVKQEFKPLLKLLAVIVLPLIFVDLFLKSFMMRGMLSLMVSGPLNQPFAEKVGLFVITYLMALFVIYWVALFVMSYVQVYTDRFSMLEQKQITPGEVWRVMSGNVGKVLGVSLLYFFIVMMGCVFFFIPGIYFAVAFVFAPLFVVFRGKSVSASLGASMNLVRGRWWSLLGYLLVLQMILGALSYVFNIPYMVVFFKSAFSRATPGVYEMTFSLMLQGFGQYVLQVVALVGIAVRFFGFLEQDEHTGLLNKIEQMGEDIHQTE